MLQFNLADYLPEILAISENNGCTKTAAVDRMIVNLNTFREYNKGTGSYNYHTLGQLWGDLTAAQKIEQKKEAKQLVMIPDNNINTTRRRRRS